MGRGKEKESKGKEKKLLRKAVSAHAVSQGRPAAAQPTGGEEAWCLGCSAAPNRLPALFRWLQETEKAQQLKALLAQLNEVGRAGTPLVDIRRPAGLAYSC